VRGLEVFGIDQLYQALYPPDLVQENHRAHPTHPHPLDGAHQLAALHIPELELGC